MGLQGCPLLLRRRPSTMAGVGVGVEVEVEVDIDSPATPEPLALVGSAKSWLHKKRGRP